jgi:heptosyltransferase-3
MSDSRVVVFRPGALGDTIVAADALAAIRGRFPDRTIELVGNAPAAALLRASGLVDVVTPFDSLDVASLFERTPTVVPRWRDAELVVLWLYDAQKIADAFRAAGARRVLVATPRLEARPHPPRASSGSPASPRGTGEVTHISDYLVESLKPAGISSSVAGDATLLSPQWTCNPGSPDGRTALLHPGSGSPSKNWPPANFATLATRLLDRGLTVRLLSGPADADALAAVRTLTPRSEIPLDEPPNIGALADLLASADLYVGNDSGVSHLSARLGVPTVAVFGPTDPRVWAPRGQRVAVIDGAGRWPIVEQVWDAAVALVGGTSGGGPAAENALGGSV